jgi:monofunctional biosynthetic peptidoglycan transglycosylase
MVKGDRFRGASTISQQMVKNVYLSESRTPWRKIHEIILTHKVEEALSKDRILEVYLNSIEFGPAIYGIKEASYHYFKKHPSELSPREGAFIAMLLPSPKKYYVSFKKKSLTKFAQGRIKAILRKMKMAKIISEERMQTELVTPFSWEQP